MPTGDLNYTRPHPPHYITIPRASTSGSTSRVEEAEAHRSMLKVGMGVCVKPGIPCVHGQDGIIVETGPLRDGDCSVLLDGWDHPLGFFWHEIVISKTPEPEVRISVLGYRVPSGPSG